MSYSKSETSALVSNEYEGVRLTDQNVIDECLGEFEGVYFETNYLIF